MARTGGAKSTDLTKFFFITDDFRPLRNATLFSRFSFPANFTCRCFCVRKQWIFFLLVMWWGSVSETGKPILTDYIFRSKNCLQFFFCHRYSSTQNFTRGFFCGRHDIMTRELVTRYLIVAMVKNALFFFINLPS